MAYADQISGEDHMDKPREEQWADKREEQMNKQQKSQKGTLEALLFAMGDSVELSRLAEILRLSRRETEAILEEMRLDYEREDRGIRLLALKDSYQLCTKKEYYDDLIRLARQAKKPHLTNVVIETLSIIAYRQPVTKGEIEKIRGVSSDHAVNRLLEYDLIEEKGRLEVPGHPILFGTTERFLRYFGLKSPEELPALPENMVEKFREEAEEEIRVDV